MPRDHLRPNHALYNFQIGLPVYVKGKTIQAGGRFFKRGDLFPWQELGMTAEKVANMFPRLVHHKIDLTAAPKAEGDGPPTTGKPHVVPEKTADQLLQEKTPAEMSIRELRIVAKAKAVPIKRTRGEQLEAVEEFLTKTIEEFEI